MPICNLRPVIFPRLYSRQISALLLAAFLSSLRYDAIVTSTVYNIQYTCCNQTIIYNSEIYESQRGDL